MGLRMRNTQGLNRMFVSATDSSGNIYVAQYHTYGVKKYNYSDMSARHFMGTMEMLDKVVVAELIILTELKFITVLYT